MEEHLEEIIRYYQQGWTLKEIALKYTGIENDRKEVSKLLKQNNIPIRKRLYEFNQNFFEEIKTEEQAY